MYENPNSINTLVIRQKKPYNRASLEIISLVSPSIQITFLSLSSPSKLISVNTWSIFFALARGNTLRVNFSAGPSGSDETACDAGNTLGKTSERRSRMDGRQTHITAVPTSMTALSRRRM